MILKVLRYATISKNSTTVHAISSVLMPKLENKSINKKSYITQKKEYKHKVIHHPEKINHPLNKKKTLKNIPTKKLKKKACQKAQKNAKA